MQKLIGIAALLLSMSGCAVHAVKTQTLTIQPSSQAVVVNATCKATSTDMLLVHTATANLELTRSDQETAPAAPVATK
jgi:hypothetical protein